ncbi:MAG: YeeE/YedE family protein [Actinobacteria bacterium]|nr:YeeE/YedE family protein [Actinomycetota bacterium]
MSLSSLEAGAPGPTRGASSAWSSPRTAAAVAVAVLLVAGAFVLSSVRDGDQSPAVSLLIGAALGLAFERGRFCFFCIFRDAFEHRNTAPLLSILTAVAVGAVGHAVVFGLYLPNPRGEGLPPLAHISPVSLPLVAGAFAFGVGMVLSGACISGHLYRLGQGDLRGLPALAGSLVGFGLGFLTWNGLYLRFVTESPTLWLPRWWGYGGALVATLAVVAALAVVAVCTGRGGDAGPVDAPVSVAGSLRDLWERVAVRRWSPVATGAVVGTIGTVAYLRIAPLGVTSQLSTVSRTFLDGRGALPEVLHGIDVLKGCVGTVSTAVTNNGWLVIGLVGASLASALAGGRFRVVRPTLRGGASGALGGVLLGWGSMTALGCTVGVLLSGTQAFALSGWVFAAALVGGVLLGLRLRLHRFV